PPPSTGTRTYGIRPFGTQPATGWSAVDARPAQGTDPFAERRRTRRRDPADVRPADPGACPDAGRAHPGHPGRTAARGGGSGNGAAPDRGPALRRADAA